MSARSERQHDASPPGSPSQMEGTVTPTCDRLSMSLIEELCRKNRLKMTTQRRVIAQVLTDSCDHPSVSSLYERARKHAPHIGVATVYRTLRLFEKIGFLSRMDFREGRARYEPKLESHHDHLIDLDSGKVLEFRDEEIERRQREIARKMGYRLIDHRLELFALPLSRD